MTDGFVLGVDLGTSHTVAMLRRPDGRTRPLLFDGQPLLPSAAYLDTTGRLHVGRDAVRLGQAEPGRFEPNPKRHVDAESVLLGGAEVPPADLLAALLGAVAREAVAATGFLPPAVLTYPAAWGSRRREILTTALARAGWPPATQLLPEPVAAARYFADVLRRPVPVGSALAVFDFGGGTLDIAVVRNEGVTPQGLPRFAVAASGGIDELGGLDLDAALVEHLGAGLRTSEPAAWAALTDPVTLAQWRARRQFWDDVRGAKEMLSRTALAPVPVPGVERAVHLTRDEFEAAAGPLLRRGVAEAGAVIRAAGVAPRELAGLFLVGGSSRVPLVARLLHSELGIAPTVLEQPELPVAEGATIVIASTMPDSATTPAEPMRPAAVPPMTDTMAHPAPEQADRPGAPVGGRQSAPSGTDVAGVARSGGSVPGGRGAADPDGQAGPDVDRAARSGGRAGAAASAAAAGLGGQAGLEAGRAERPGGQDGLDASRAAGLDGQAGLDADRAARSGGRAGAAASLVADPRGQEGFDVGGSAGMGGQAGLDAAQRDTLPLAANEALEPTAAAVSTERDVAALPALDASQGSASHSAASSTPGPRAAKSSAAGPHEAVPSAAALQSAGSPGPASPGSASSGSASARSASSGSASPGPASSGPASPGSAPQSAASSASGPRAAAASVGGPHAPAPSSAASAAPSVPQPAPRAAVPSAADPHAAAPAAPSVAPSAASQAAGSSGGGAQGAEPQYAEPVDPWATGEAAAFGNAGGGPILHPVSGAPVSASPVSAGPTSPAADSWLASTHPDPEADGPPEARAGLPAYRRKGLWIVAAATVVVLGAAATVVALFWPGYRALDYQPLADLRRFPPAVPVTSAFNQTALRDGRAYFASVDDNGTLGVVAVATDTGKTVWPKPSTAAGIAKRWEYFFTLPDAIVAITDADSDTNSRRMVLLDPADGSKLWERLMDRNDEVLFASDKIVLVDRKEGRLAGLEINKRGKWSWELPNPKTEYGQTDTHAVAVTTEADFAGPATTSGVPFAEPFDDDRRIVQIGADDSARVIDVDSGDVVAGPRQSVATTNDLIIAHNGRLIVAESANAHRLFAYDLEKLEPRVLYTPQTANSRLEHLTPCGADRICLVETAGYETKGAQVVAIDAVKGGVVWRQTVAQAEDVIPVGEAVLVPQNYSPAYVTLVDADGKVAWSRAGVAGRLDGGNLLQFNKALSASADDPALAGEHLGDAPVQLGPLAGIRTSTCSWDTTHLACVAGEDFVLQRFAD
jgi:outer membrane protein assembly factor BamB